MNTEPKMHRPFESGPQGFQDPVTDSQIAFRVLMNAIAHPALPQAFASLAQPCGRLGPEAAAIMLTLVDHETTIWLDDTLAQDAMVRSFVAFHCGAPIVSDPIRATFAFLSDPAGLCPLARFAQGEPDYPDRSTTIIVQTSRFELTGYSFAGPGVLGQRNFGFTPTPLDFELEWTENALGFPLGVDLFLTAPGDVVAIPRSLRIVKT